MLHELSIDDSEEADDTPVDHTKRKRFRLKRIGIVALLALVLATIVTVVVGIIIGHIHT